MCMANSEAEEGGYLRHSSLHTTLHAECSKVCLPFLLPLGQGHIQGLGDNDASVHVCHSLGGLLRGGETDEPKALGAAGLVHHHLGAGDVAKLGKLLPQALVIHLILQVLHVEVDALIPVGLYHHDITNKTFHTAHPLGVSLHLLSLIATMELHHSLLLLLRSSHVERTAVDQLA